MENSNELKTMLDTFQVQAAESTKLMSAIATIVQSNARILEGNANRLENLTGSIEKIAMITERLMTRLEELEKHYVFQGPIADD